MKNNEGEVTRQELHNLFSDIIAPRPIAWVSSVNRNGVKNLAPYSSLGVTSIGQVVMFGISTPKLKAEKDTLRNIKYTNDFVINVVTEELINPMNKSAISYASNISEFDMVGVTPERSKRVKSPYVKESPVNLECQLRSLHRYGDRYADITIVIGKVVLIRRKKGDLKLVGRCGGYGKYIALHDNQFTVKRPGSGR